MNETIIAYIVALAGVVTAAVTGVLTNRGKRQMDVTAVAQAGFAVVPEMGERVLEALEQVRELTEQVRALTEALGAAEAKAAHLGRELDEASRTAVALRSENQLLRKLINEKGI